MHTGLNSKRKTSYIVWNWAKDGGNTGHYTQIYPEKHQKGGGEVFWDSRFGFNYSDAHRVN